jgi:nitronate monooxygenase
VWRDIWSAGQGVGNIHEVLPAGELIARMVGEYDDTRRRLCGAR